MLQVRRRGNTACRRHRGNRGQTPQSLLRADSAAHRLLHGKRQAPKRGRHETHRRGIRRSGYGARQSKVTNDLR